MRNFLIFIFLLLFFFLTSCAVPQDKSPAPIDHNLRTLEMISCNKRDVGLLGCFYEESNLQNKLTVPLYGTGEFLIESDRCNYLKNERFEKVQNFEITYAELLKDKPTGVDSCLYDIKVFIDGFDKGFRGSFLLSYKQFKSASFTHLSRKHLGLGAIQLEEGNDTSGDILFSKINYPGLIFWEGCELENEKRFDSQPKINFTELFPNSYLIDMHSCILTIGIIPDSLEKPVEFAKYQINFYGKPVSPLPLPAISYDKKKEKLKVTFGEIIAAYDVAGKRKIRKKNSKRKIIQKVKKDTEVWVKWATSNGRFNMVQIKNGEVIWKSCVH